MARRKRHRHRKHAHKDRHSAGEEGRIKPRNPLVPIVHGLGHKTHEDKRRYRRHAKHRRGEPS